MYEIEQCLEDNGGELTEELAELISDTEMSIKQKADGYRAVIAKFSHKAEMADKEIQRMQEIKKSANNAVKRLKEHILGVMGIFGIRKIEGDLCSMTRTTSKALEVNEDLLLMKYADKIAKLREALPDYIEVELKVSKTAIKNAFKDSDILPEGCVFVENESLRIK
jgi:hypothetical protein